MRIQTFHDYLSSSFPTRNSGTIHSYLTAIKILDEIFQQKDVFELKNQSLAEINDPLLLAQIIEFVAEEEDKFRKKEESIFDLGKPTQTSYPRNRFCTAAIRRLGEYVNIKCGEEASDIMTSSACDGKKLSEKLLKKFNINDIGTEKECRAKRRIGQDIFRAIVLNIYHSKCCLTGIDVPEVLRASHIIPWAERKDSRLNPENGLCLSATYDAAFDKHLISFDEDFTLILSPMLKEAYSSDAFQTYFLNFEGKKISLPYMFSPSKEFLLVHRSKLII